MDGVKRFLGALLALLATLLTLSAFDKKENSACLEYGVDIELIGTLKKETFPGPPEWESVEKGDEPLIYWILHLERPICMNQPSKDELIDVAEKNINRIQINPANLENMYKDYRSLLNKRVKAAGTLYHQHTAYHVTTVVMTARKIDYAP